MSVVGDEVGQSTVEYAVVVAAFIVIVVALGLLSEFLHNGVLVEHAVSAASHNVAASPGGAVDVFCY